MGIRPLDAIQPQSLPHLESQDRNRQSRIVRLDQVVAREVAQEGTAEEAALAVQGVV